jgi:hypothetical protein
VYFHRTTPGGCCDCGDTEAWNIAGCCERHRPPPALLSDDAPHHPDDPFEAVRASRRGYTLAHETLTLEPTALPPRLTAALAVVVGAAVHALLDAVNGAGIGADPVQWKRQWADEAAKIANGVVHPEDYALVQPKDRQGNDDDDGGGPQNIDPPVSLQAFWEEAPATTTAFPHGFHLQLRLHNDDVHTFDEVIEALHKPRSLRRHSEDRQSLVALRDHATEMTHHVDADGQVTVKTFTSFPAALQGYQSLKRRGLHCAVVSSVQVQAEHRARALASWLSEISAAHPAAAALVVHALVQVGEGDETLADFSVWPRARSIPPWAATDASSEEQACLRRFAAFPPHLPSSYVTREQAELLHGIALTVQVADFVHVTGADPHFYGRVPYRLCADRYKKSPHALWGTLPQCYVDPTPPHAKHPLLQRLATVTTDGTENTTNRADCWKDVPNALTETVYVVDTDLRKQQEADRITSTVFPHRLPGLQLVSGVGTIRLDHLDARRPPLPSPMDWRHLLATSSFRAPASTILWLLLLDPYPTKQVRGAIHALILSLLTDARFKSRVAGALGVAYRPLSTLFCAGVGTEADSPLHFTVQIFTAGSLVRALGSGPATEALLISDDPNRAGHSEASIGVFTSPIAHTIVRCIHTNLLGATKEVNMILNHTTSGTDDAEEDPVFQPSNDSLLPALTYVAGEHPLMTPLPAAPDDGFLDSRSTRHKRLPHMLRDLEYVIETPGTAIRLLLPRRFPVYQGPPLSMRGEDVLAFPVVFSRMLRLAQGMDPQKRKISGGHVEYEHIRWLEAFGLSLNFAGARDALSESPPRSSSVALGADYMENVMGVREALGNIGASLLREIKLWLYREGMLETGLPLPPGGAHGATDMAQVESLQRSTLHVSGSQSTSNDALSNSNAGAVALACATGVKMTEAQLSLIENVLKAEAVERFHSKQGQVLTPKSMGPVMGDWLRVPHSPLAGDSLSFHIPLHRALAESIRCVCALSVSEASRKSEPSGWWKLPVLDGIPTSVSSDTSNPLTNPLVPLMRSTLRSGNCRVVWTAGPDCSAQEAQRRRSRSRAVSANIAVAKIIHSLADHPIRCLAAAQQIDRHLWARNGSSVAGMAMNYSGTPLCRSFRDLDLLLVQLSAAGMSVGLGARRVFSLLLSRFSMDGYLCDPERRSQVSGSSSPTGNGGYGAGSSAWVKPPRLQDAEHAVILSEAFFSTMCVLVTELPPPPPVSVDDDTFLRQSVKRELLHALAAEPRSRSEAMTAAAVGIIRKEDSEGSSRTSGGGGLFKQTFAEVLNEIGKPKSQGSSRATSGPPAFELKPECCDEYDPTFFHLRRQDHQHAMDIVARLRKQKWGNSKEKTETYCLPIVCTPPKAHPRFLACRLLLHLPAIDAAIRRSLLFALTGGSWLPPPEPRKPAHPPIDEDVETFNTLGVSDTAPRTIGDGDIPMITFNRRLFQSQTSSSSFLKRIGADLENATPFSKEIVASSSVSFLEVLQLLTLQTHTLEDCASLHRFLPDLDEESRALSFGLSINSYLGRLVRVPESLVDVWALQPYPEGPLRSKGTGKKRGSILGLLIALYEHRDDHGNSNESDGADYGQGDEGHGGARILASSGLKWLLRFVNALVDGAPTVGAASHSATSGGPIKPEHYTSPKHESSVSSWTINEDIRSTIQGMLFGLPDLWPQISEDKPAASDNSAAKSKEAGKAAQKRVMDLMKKKQLNFASTIAPSNENKSDSTVNGDQDSELCIICRCDDADGENNGPLGYLGHVQRSRTAQLRATVELMHSERPTPTIGQTYRVVGHMGCQLRETETLDSTPLTCLPKGSVVTVSNTYASAEYDILSRRVLVRHVSKDPITRADVVSEGWASVQSSQGYVILSPLVSMCYTNSRWGTTRPIIKQCGHAAHLKCVEAHTLSLHQRAAGDQPYDGRFAANISDGEFLCPLCKQLSNILIPRDSFAQAVYSSDMEIDESVLKPSETRREHRKTRALLVGSGLSEQRMAKMSNMGRKALNDFGTNLHVAMGVPWERSTPAQKRQHQRWHPAIHKWDYEESVDDDTEGYTGARMKNILRMFRQQLIAWAAIGHTAAAAESSTRGVEEVLPFGIVSQTSDPWSDYNIESRDRHPLLLELKRTLTAASGLLEVLCFEMRSRLAQRERLASDTFIVNSCLADILDGWSWIMGISSVQSKNTAADLALWSELTALLSSIPCHVARDGAIPQRGEARATAAAMWAARGIGTTDQRVGEPPAPLSITQIFSNKTTNLPPIARDWGTTDPLLSPNEDPQLDMPRIPFRPGIATAFLYTPLLAWDVTTLAGAILSTTLLNESNDLPTNDELMRIAQVLLVGRLIQALITPNGIELPDEMELDEEDAWSAKEAECEGLALARLVAHCQTLVTTKYLDGGASLVGSTEDLSSRAVLAGVGRAILPFSRTLVLLLRACHSAIRERQRKTTGHELRSDLPPDALDKLLCNADLMTAEDGFHIFKALQCPLPSALIASNSEWFSLINRWLVAVVGLELHHGSMGRHIVPTVVSPGSTGGTFTLADELPPRTDSLAGTTLQAHRSEDTSPDVRMGENTQESNLPWNQVANQARLEELDRAIRNGGGATHRNLGGGVMMEEDSNEEIVDEFELDGPRDMIAIAEQLLGVTGQANAESNDEIGESSEDNSDSGSEGEKRDADREFAHVSRSPILSYQPSLLAVEEIGPGRHATLFEFSTASAVMSDLSHFGLKHRRNIPTFSLIRLPKSFVELYNLVNKIKGREDGTNTEESEEVSNAETAICLLTGTVMRSGSARRSGYNRAHRLAGACTIHARKNGSGIGIFFLVQKCTVLLMHNNKSAYSPSLYVDEHGEEDPGLRRGRPLFLNQARYHALEQLWRQNGIPREVAQIRSTSDRVIRDNWY